MEGGKQEKEPMEQGQQPTTNKEQIQPKYDIIKVWKSNTGHRWDASALTTGLALLQQLLRHKPYNG